MHVLSYFGVERGKCCQDVDVRKRVSKLDCKSPVEKCWIAQDEPVRSTGEGAKKQGRSKRTLGLRGGSGKAQVMAIKMAVQQSKGGAELGLGHLRGPELGLGQGHVRVN